MHKFDRGVITRIICGNPFGMGLGLEHHWSVGFGKGEGDQDEADECLEAIFQPEGEEE
jgi:hypothetical protein